MPFLGEEGACPWDGVVHVLVGAAHLAGIEVGGVKQVKVDRLNRAGPSGHLSAQLGSEPFQQAVARHIPAIVKGDPSIGDIDVVAGIRTIGHDPLGSKTRARWMRKVNTRQNVAGAVSEKGAVRLRPAFFGVLLGSRRRLEHGSNRRSVRP